MLQEFALGAKVFALRANTLQTLPLRDKECVKKSTLRDRQLKTVPLGDKQFSPGAKTFALKAKTLQTLPLT